MADDFPAPDRPEMITKSTRCDAGWLPLPLTMRVSLVARTSAISASRLVDVGVQVAGDLLRQPGDLLELLARCAEHGVRGAEVLEQRALARRPDARKLVHDRLRHRAVAAQPVVRDREAMGLVAHALEQL